MDARAYLYDKLTYEPKASGEKISEKLSCFRSCVPQGGYQLFVETCTSNIFQKGDNHLFHTKCGMIMILVQDKEQLVRAKG